MSFAAKRLTGNIAIPVLIAASFFWSWVDSTFFGLMQTVDLNDEQLNRQVFSVSFLFSLIPLVVVAVGRTPLFKRLVHMRLFFGSAAFLGFLGTVLISIGTMLGNSSLAVFGSAGAGLFLGIGILVWGYVCTCQGARRAFIHLASVWAFDSIFNTALISLKDLPAEYFLSLMPLASTLLLGLSMRTHLAKVFADPYARSVRAQSSKQLKRTNFLKEKFGVLAAIFLASIASGILIALTLLDPAQNSQESNYLYVFVRNVACFILLVRFTFSPICAQSVFRDGIIVMAVGLISASVALSFGLVSLNFSHQVFSLGYACFDLMIWMTIAKGRFVLRWSLPRTIGFVQLFNQVGILAGTGVPLLFAFETDPGLLVWVLLGVAFVILFSAVFLTQTYPAEPPLEWFGDKASKPLEASGPAQDAAAVSFEGGLEDLARLHAFTKQESKVFVLLVEGRSIPYISEQLHITQNTTKTHVRHIYEKAQVHGKQELIDFARRRTDEL